MTVDTWHLHRVYVNAVIKKKPGRFWIFFENSLVQQRQIFAVADVNISFSLKD